MSTSIISSTGRVVVDIEPAEGDPVREECGTAEAEALLRAEGVADSDLRYLGEEVASFGEAMLTLFDGTWIMVKVA